MQTPACCRLPLALLVAVATVYCVWIGHQWLRLPLGDKELSASASRVWDIQTELRAGHGLPWWTPHFMSGSSYAINHSRGFYLLPWLALHQVTDLISAGKLMALLAMWASALAMYGCGRYWLKNDWAAALAGVTFLVHPAQLNRAAGSEHMTIALFFPLIPLLWWTLARALDQGGIREAVICALVVCWAMWTDNKQAVITFLYLAGYLVWWWVTQRPAPLAAARTLARLAVLVLALGAFILVPGLIEAGHVKLFYGDPLREWQKNYAFRSLLGLVDRDGAVTRELVAGILRRAQNQPVAEPDVRAAQQLFGLQMDAPEKYAGLVVMALLAVTAAGNYRRQNRGLFWLIVGLFLFSVALASGLGGVWAAHQKTWTALSRWGGLSGGMWLALLALAAALVWFARRKLTTPRRWAVAGAVAVAFWFVPVFDLLAGLPYFKEIRAPYSFYDAPVAFWSAMIAGFFVTDVLRRRVALIVGGVAVLLVADYWPYQRPVREPTAPAHTADNLRAAYGALQADRDWVKTYSLSGRYFHLLGPMYSGKPQVWEAFYNWQAPLGLGLLAQAGGISREFLDLIGARYLVVDKTDPGLAGHAALLTQLRQQYAVQTENADFVVFRNPTARPYVSASTRVCYFPEDVRRSAPAALALAARHITMVHEPVPGAEPFPPLGNGAPVSLGEVELTRHGHHQVRIRLTAPQPCWLVINESYYPFWTATRNGAPTPVRRVQCGLIGVEVEAGPVEVWLRYRPPRAVPVSGLVSVLALAGAGVVLVQAYRRSSR